MPTCIVSARVDERLKAEVEALLAAMGLTTSDAVRFMMMRIAHDKKLPFEPIDYGVSRPESRDIPDLVTTQMREHATCRTHDHFGFSGYRAAIACLYARPEGAAQAEVNQAAWQLGSNQSGFFNMLRQAKNTWKHEVCFWNDPTRGRVYKLIFNPNHNAPRAVDPPSNWRDMNVPTTPPGVKASSYKPRA
jgi:addiction module RelB/DinJ family antitoxin